MPFHPAHTFSGAADSIARRLGIYDTDTFEVSDLQFGGQPPESVAFDAFWSADGARLTAAFLVVGADLPPKLLASPIGTFGHAVPTHGSIS